MCISRSFFGRPGAMRGKRFSVSLVGWMLYVPYIFTTSKQLSGTPGVAEVSGWGGYVKQYEVALSTDRLNANGLTIADVFSAIEKNNANTGGGYIEENANQYFIRGIGVAK